MPSTTPSASGVDTELSQLPSPRLSQVLLKAVGATIGFLLLFILITLGVLTGIIYTKISAFAQTAGTTVSELRRELESAWSYTPVSTDGHKTFLLLGVDTLENRGDAPPLTDTIMLISLDLQSGAVHLLSLPRDVWSPEYQTKINALYYYGLERYPDSPEQFPTEVISELTNVPIHHTVVVSLDQVAQIIDLLGGVPVTVTTPFTDSEFPRDDVDIHSETDPAVLYKTVTFSEGEQVLSGSRALEYIRSRHSGDDQGTDDARAARQQQVIQGIVTQLKDPQLYLDPVTLGKGYALYQTEFGDSFPVQEALSTAKVLWPYRESLTVTQSVLPIFPASPDGVIMHPPVSAKNPQWVYEVLDRDNFVAAVHAALGISQDTAQVSQ